MLVGPQCLGHCSFSGRFLQSSATPKIQDLHQVHLFSMKFQMKRSIKQKKRLLHDVLQFELQRIIAHFLAACNTTRIYAYKYSILARSSSSPSCTFSVQTAGFGEIGNMGIKGLLYNFHLFSLVLLFVGFLGSVHGRLPLIKKPDPDDAAVTARWLVSNNVWGVLKYILSFPVSLLPVLYLDSQFLDEASFLLNDLGFRSVLCLCRWRPKNLLRRFLMFVVSFVFLYDLPLHMVLFKSGWIFVVICLKIRLRLLSIRGESTEQIVVGCSSDGW